VARGGGPPEYLRGRVSWGAACLSRGTGADTQPILDDAHKERAFELDIANPLELAYLKESLEFCLRMKELARGTEFHGRPVEVNDYAPTGTDGPLPCR